MTEVVWKSIEEYKPPKPSIFVPLGCGACGFIATMIAEDIVE